METLRRVLPSGLQVEIEEADRRNPRWAYILENQPGCVLTAFYTRRDGTEMVAQELFSGHRDFEDFQVRRVIEHLEIQKAAHA